VKLLDRYMLSSLRGPIIYCLSAFCMIFLVSSLFGNLSRLLEAAPPLRDILLYYLLQLLPTLEYLIPASLLLATLYTLWQLSRQNELAAMRACGVSLYRTMVPLLAVGLVFTLVTALIKETAAPAAMVWTHEFYQNGFKRLEKDVRHDVAYYNTADNRLWLIGALDLKTPRVFQRAKVMQERPDGTRAREWHTSKAEWLDGQWWFHDVAARDYDEQDNPIGELKPAAPEGGSVLEMSGFSERPDDIVNELRDWTYLSTAEMLRYLAAHPGLSEESRARKTYDVHARLAMPWACFVVILFGIPTGARGARHSALTGMFLAVAFFFLYYTLSQTGLFLAKRQMLSPWIGAWLSNIVSLGAGIVMLVRMR